MSLPPDSVRAVVARVIHAAGLRWPAPNAYREDGYLVENHMKPGRDVKHLYTREDVELLMYEVFKEASYPTEALPDALRFRHLLDNGRCDSKHGSGFTVGDQQKAVVTFRYWCEPDEAIKAIDAARAKP